MVHPGGSRVTDSTGQEGRDMRPCGLGAVRACLWVRTDWIYVFGLAVATVLFMGAWWIPFHYPASDNGQYLMFAQAFAEGKGYAAIHGPEQSTGAHFPFGWPWLLSLVYRMFGKNHAAYHILTGLFFVGATVAAYALARCFFQFRTALLTGFACASQFILCSLSQSAFAEVPFTFFLYASLAFYYLAWSRDRPRLFYGAIACALGAALTRAIGEASVLALGSAFLLTKRWRLLGVLALAYSAKIGLHFALQGTEWIERGYLTKDIVLTRHILRPLTTTGGSSPETGTFEVLLSVFPRYALNARRLVLTHIPQNIFPSQYNLWTMNPIKMLWGTLLSGTVLLGVWVGLRTRLLFLCSTFVLMVAALLTRSNTWAVYRYYAPMSALFFLLGCMGMRWIMRRRLLTCRRKAATTALMVLGVFFVVDKTHYNVVQAGRSFPREHREVIEDYYGLCSCIGDQSCGGTLIGTRASALAFVATGSKAVTPPKGDVSPWTLRQWIDDRCLTHVMVPGWWPFCREGAARYDSALAVEPARKYYRIRIGSTHSTYFYGLNGGMPPQGLVSCIRGRASGDVEVQVR